MALFYEAASVQVTSVNLRQEEDELITSIFIAAQNYIGSVVKQCLDDGQDDDEDDEDDGTDGVFGVTTVINITKRKVGSTF